MVDSTNEQPSDLKVAFLYKSFKSFKFILHDDGDDFKTFHNYLKEHGHTLLEHPTFLPWHICDDFPSIKVTPIAMLPILFNVSLTAGSATFEKFIENNQY